MSTHTPGPWEVQHGRDIVPVGEYAFTGGICQVDRNIEANARLIAAAPDLLACLRDVVRSIDGGMPDECATYSHRLRAAIAKATGEEQA